VSLARGTIWMHIETSSLAAFCSSIWTRLEAKGPYVEMTGGVSGLQDTTVENRFPADLRNRAWEAMDGRWRLVDPRVVERFMVSNRPPWLVDLITESAAAIPCELIPTGNMGGDQQVFTQAGIVATSIGSSGNIHHSQADTTDRLLWIR